MRKSTLSRLDVRREKLAARLSPLNAELVQNDLNVVTTSMCERDRAIAAKLKQTLRDMAALNATAA